VDLDEEQNVILRTHIFEKLMPKFRIKEITDQLYKEGKN